VDIKQKRRDQISIITKILETAREGTRKTQIMYRANLSFSQLNEYITFLISNGLIRQTTVKGKEVYVATARGLLITKRYSELLKIIEAPPQPEEQPPLVN